MVSPLGALPMVGVASRAPTAMTRPGRDWAIADELARQHPKASSTVDMRYGRNSGLAIEGNDVASPGYTSWHTQHHPRSASNPLAPNTKYTNEFGLEPLPAIGPSPNPAGMPANVNRSGPQLVMADNSRSSAPGTVVNSLGEPQTIRAYHGSPHRFDKFSTEHIGKGEGAQSYGHGIYLAEQEAVARSYRDALSKPGSGHMYEVNIKGKADDFLDWDKPIAQQSEAIKAAFPVEIHHLTGAQLHNELSGMIRAERPQHKFGDTPFAQWKDPTQEIQKTISDRLRQAGIPGIRYLDQDSRKLGAGTSNYVLFDDGLAKINRIYADNSRSSAPGTVVNSTPSQQDDTGVEEIMRKYGLPQ